MKSDIIILSKVQNQIYSELTVIAHNIRISVNFGIVTLSGTLKSEIERSKAEKVAAEVKGVTSVINNIELHLPNQETDHLLADIVKQGLESRLKIKTEAVRIRVREGWVTLDGEVDSYYQVSGAYSVITRIEGVRGITNLLTINYQVTSKMILDKITSEFQKNAVLEIKNINVEVKGDTAILKGTLPTWAKYKEAEYAALSSPGINRVENRIHIGIPMETNLN